MGQIARHLLGLFISGRIQDGVLQVHLTAMAPVPPEASTYRAANWLDVHRQISFSPIPFLPPGIGEEMMNQP